MAQLPNPFLNSTALAPASVESAVAFSDPSGSDATAAPFAESSMTNGSDQGAPAAAPTENPSADALGKCNCAYSYCEDFDRPDCKAKAAGLDPWPDGPTDHIGEIFFYARKLSAEARTFVPDYPGIYQAMLDPNAPRALETDPVWADEPPLFLQRQA